MININFFKSNPVRILTHRQIFTFTKIKNITTTVHPTVQENLQTIIDRGSLETERHLVET